jgi:LPS export ABC transporter protein LptC
MYKIELPKNKPEYNVINANISIYNNQGNILYSISSKKAWQYPNSESMFLQNISALTYESNSNKIKYQLNSNLAWLNYNKQVVYLIESAHMRISSNYTNDFTDLYGDNILIDFENKLVKSKSFIKVINGKNLLISKGFMYNSNLDLLVLESNVRIVYNYNNSNL